MTPWWQGRLASLDLEATSTDPEEARVVQIAFAQVGGGGEADFLSVIVDPGVEVPAEAAEVHGFTTERVRAEGTPARVALPVFFRAIEYAIGQSYPLVAHNAPYDLTVAEREAWRLGIVLDLSRALVVDTHTVDRHLDRFRPKRVASHNLEDCCRVWDAPFDGAAHDAAADALAAARLAYRLGQRGKVKRRRRTPEELAEYKRLAGEWRDVKDDLPALCEAQARWYAAAAADREEYFRAGDPKMERDPDPGFVASRDWPYIPRRVPQEVV